MIVQTASNDGKTTDITFTISNSDLDRAKQVLESERTKIGYAHLSSSSGVVKVSVVGGGLRSHAGVAATMFETLAEKKINIQAIETSEIVLGVLIEEEYTELALRALHTAYGLDTK
jgi:aspartate kinase